MTVYETLSIMINFATLVFVMTNGK
ncbi:MULTISPECIES: putative holin-like toxin [Paenibacillus]